MKTDGHGRSREIVVLEDPEDARLLVVDSENAVMHALVDVACQGRDGLVDMHDPELVERMLPQLRRRLGAAETAILLANSPCCGDLVVNFLNEITDEDEWHALLKWALNRKEDEVDPTDPFERALRFACNNIEPAMNVLMKHWPAQTRSLDSLITNPDAYWAFKFFHFLRREPSADYLRAWETLNRAARGLLREDIPKFITDQREVKEDRYCLRASPRKVVSFVNVLYAAMEPACSGMGQLHAIEKYLRSGKIPGYGLAERILGYEPRQTKANLDEVAARVFVMARYFADRENAKRRAKARRLGRSFTRHA